MASNTFGNIFKITTWGESHGPAIGVVIDGCPAGLELSCSDINQSLKMRSPGKSPLTSARLEPDIAKIYSGVFEGKTTGTPISILIQNKDANSDQYEDIKNLLRPGYANYTYLKKYGCFDYRGGGRASARETACRVAAGAVAKKILEHEEIEIASYIKNIGDIEATIDKVDVRKIKTQTYENPLFCPVHKSSQEMITLLEKIKQDGDSIGGIVEFIIKNLPAGLGDPMYEKLEANLAKAMMSIPATKGFEIGEGFNAAFMKGSEHNDAFITNEITKTNHAGGTLGGISTGMPLIGRVAFKPTSSIRKQQKTVDLEGNNKLFQLQDNSRHDPCVAIRAVPVVEAMCAIVIADALLMNRCARP